MTPEKSRIRRPSTLTRHHPEPQPSFCFAPKENGMLNSPKIIAKEKEFNPQMTAIRATEPSPALPALLNPHVLPPAHSWPHQNFEWQPPASLVSTPAADHSPEWCSAGGRSQKWSAADQLLGGVHDLLLGMDVHRAGWLVKDQNRSVFQECPCNGQPLPLPAGKAAAALAHFCIVTIRQ